jgi:hypothetical protein
MLDYPKHHTLHSTYSAKPKQNANGKACLQALKTLESENTHKAIVIDQNINRMLINNLIETSSRPSPDKKGLSPKLFLQKLPVKVSLKILMGISNHCRQSKALRQTCSSKNQLPRQPSHRRGQATSRRESNLLHGLRKGICISAEALWRHHGVLTKGGHPT